MHYDYVDIGTSDFDHSGELNDDVKVLLVEPLKCYYDKLPNSNNITKVNCAVSNFNGFIDIYYVDPADIEKHDLPIFLKGCNSVITRHATTLFELKKGNLEHLYRCEQVKTVTLKNLFLECNVSSITNLKIDTEGHDHIILEQVLEFVKKGFSITNIQFEFFLFGDHFNNVKDINSLLDYFSKIGYSWHMLDKINLKLTKNL